MKLLLVFSIAAIMVFALLPGYMNPAFIADNDKVVHATVFFMLAVMLHRSFPGISLVRVVMLLGLMALSIEILQYLVPGRRFSRWDLLYDGFGIALYTAGVIAVKLAVNIFQKQSDRPDKRV